MTVRRNNFLWYLNVCCNEQLSACHSLTIFHYQATSNDDHCSIWRIIVTVVTWKKASMLFAYKIATKAGSWSSGICCSVWLQHHQFPVEFLFLNISELTRDIRLIVIIVGWHRLEYAHVLITWYIPMCQLSNKSGFATVISTGGNFSSSSNVYVIYSENIKSKPNRGQPTDFSSGDEPDVIRKYDNELSLGRLPDTMSPLLPI